MDVLQGIKSSTEKKWMVAAAGVAAAAALGYAVWRQSRPSQRKPTAPPAVKSHAIVSSKDFELFEKAVSFVSSPPDGADFDLSNTQKLKLYALFKQASAGPCTLPEPGMLELDFSKHMKWKAWKALGGMSKADAAIQYAQRLDQHVPTWRVAAQLPAELREHTAGSAPPELAAAGGGGGDNPEEEEEEKGQSFDMGPTVSRLDVDALSPEDEAARNSNASAVLLAVEDADATALRSALAKSPADANAKNEFGEPVLHVAVNSGKVDLVQQLLDAGADVNATDDDGGMTALMYCTFLSETSASVDIAGLLVAAGADKAAACEEGTAFDMAKEADMPQELLEMLSV